MAEKSLESCVKLDMFFVSFRDKEGNLHQRIALKNPGGRTLLWNLGSARPSAIPVASAAFEEQEHLRVERMENMTLTRAPEWLEELIVTTTEEKDHFVAEGSGKSSVGEDIKKSAERAASVDSLGAIGGVSG